MIGWKLVDDIVALVFNLTVDSFCRQRAGLEVLIKVTLLKKIQ